MVDAFLDHFELMAVDIAGGVQMMSNDLGEDHIMDVANLRAYGFRYGKRRSAIAKWSTTMMLETQFWRSVTT